MSSANKNRRNRKTANVNDNTNKWRELTHNPLVVSIATLLITFLSSSFIGLLELPDEIDKLSENITELQNDLSNMQNNITSIDSDINELTIKNTEFSKDITYIYERITRLENMTDNALSLQLTGRGQISIEPISVNMEYYLAPPAWESTEVIAIDRNTGEEITASQLADQKLLLPYMEDSKEVFFYGQFNDNNQWDGDCTINVYENDNLMLIMESVYDNGTLLSYKQITPFTTQRNEDVWIVSERAVVNDVNKGENWNYLRSENYIKDFRFEEATIDCILNIDSFLATIETNLEGYYCGIISDGFYNDQTGNACLVKYSKDGTVRTLYRGNFVNGLFDDLTGNAWYITREENTNYMYYKGQFKQGNTINEGNSIFESNLSIDKINEYIKDFNFSCELYWFQNKGEASFVTNDTSPYNQNSANPQTRKCKLAL